MLSFYGLFKKKSIFILPKNFIVIFFSLLCSYNTATGYVGCVHKTYYNSGTSQLATSQIYKLPYFQLLWHKKSMFRLMVVLLF